MRIGSVRIIKNKMFSLVDRWYAPLALPDRERSEQKGNQLLR